MKLILTHEVSGLGTAGDVVDVKDGYARNFLVPPRPGHRRGPRAARSRSPRSSKAREVREIKSLDEAKPIKGQLESKRRHGVGQGRRGRSPVRRRHHGRHRRCRQGRRWPAARPPQDRDRHSRSSRSGTHQALVRLHPEVQAEVTLEVVAG